MFEVDIEMLKEQGLQLVDTAKKTALDLADKGKNQLELLNQQARLSKAQRQLGALVYSLHKAGEENQPLVDKYIEAISGIEKNIEEIKARMTPAERAEAEADAAETSDESDPAVRLRLYHAELPHLQVQHDHLVWVIARTVFHQLPHLDAGSCISQPPASFLILSPVSLAPI